MSFWKELKRRNVYKVGVAYLIVAWLIVQAAAIVFPHLNLPSWAVTLVIVILIIGFPLILLFAWAFEITPDGLKWTKEVPLHESITHLTGQKLNYMVTGLLVLAVAFLIIDNYLIGRHAVEPELASTETDQAPSVVDVVQTKKTIAVLPFVDISPEKDQEYFVDGLSEELLNTLAQIPDLTVIARTSSFTFKGSDKKIQEIASELGVENILEGSVRKAGNALRITAQLVKGVDGSHLWSKTYDRELKDIFTVQEDIATAVADELKATLGINKSFKQLGGTDNVEAYELYLIAKAQTVSYDLAEFSSALESINAALEIDPEFALGWTVKSNIHVGLSIFGPANRAVTELDTALGAANKAIELDHNLADAYFSSGLVKFSGGDFIEAESAFHKALELRTNPLSSSEIFIPLYYLAVGYFERAQELLEEIRQNDPLDQLSRAHYLMNFAFLGDIQRAEEEYKQGKALFGDQWHEGDIYIWSIRQDSRDVVSSDETTMSVLDYLNDYFGIDIDSPEAGLAELHKLYKNYNDNLSSGNSMIISLCAACFGDPEFAMEAAEKAINLQPVNGFYLWFPVMRDVRLFPRFKELIKDIGLVDYWNKFGWPDICHLLDNGDFDCD